MPLPSPTVGRICVSLMYWVVFDQWTTVRYADSATYWALNWDIGIVWEREETAVGALHQTSFLDTHMPSGYGRKENRPKAERFVWERSNPTGFPGNVGLDEDIGRHILQALT
jgi:hypothetical protein